MLLRAKYYDANDMSTGISLHRVEDVLLSYDPNTSVREINEILEYYNIVQFFKHKLYLKEWDTATIEKFCSTVKLLKSEIGRFFHGIHGDDLPALYIQIDYRFRNDFFKILSEYRVMARISGDQFLTFIDSQPNTLSLVVHNKALVIKYGPEITKLLTNDRQYAEIVINHFYVKHDNPEKNKTYMPSELGAQQIDTIIRNYVSWEDSNPNYLQLISGVKKAGEYPIDDRVRLQAYKRVRAFWQDHFKNEKAGMKFGVEIRFAEQSDVICEEYDASECVNRLSYSKNWISDNLDYPTLLNNFIFLFRYVDRHYRCQFLSNPKYLGVFERMMGVHGHGEYATGIGYESLKMQSVLQMYSYQLELRNHSIEIEDLFKWFFEEYLKIEFGVENYTYFSPSSQASSLEKILLIASQFDAVLKQFRFFCEDGYIDRELYEFSSGVYKIVDAPSMIENKYLYPASNEIKRELYCLFSDQSILGYTEKTGEKYDCFAKLIVSENMMVSDFHEYEQDDIKWLLNKGTIFADENGFLRMKSSVFNVLVDINQNGCVAFSYCSEKEKQYIEDKMKAGDLVAESSLFTRQEKDYLDYMLNVQQFLNGPELRNRYVHGNFPNNFKIHDNDYLELLKIMTLIVLKINEEFCLKYPSESNTAVVIV